MAVLVDLPMTAPDGSTNVTDNAGVYTWSAFGNTHIQDGGMQFDGDGDYISTLTDNRMNLISDFVIRFEMRMSQADAISGTGFRVIFDQLNTFDNGWSWQIYTRLGVLEWNVYAPTGGNPSIVTSGTSVADNQWHSIIIRRTAGIMEMLVDGVLRESANDTRIYSRQQVLFIARRGGANASPVYDYSGYIRNVFMDVNEVNLSGMFVRSHVRKNPIGWDRSAKFKTFRRMTFYPVIPVETKRKEGLRITRGVPPWWGAPGSTTVVPTQRLRGRVMQRNEAAGEDYPLVNVRVALFYRRLHTLIDIQRSDMDGYVVFENLMPASQAYYAVAFDNDDGVMQNAVIWDRLTPEPGA